MCMDDRVGSAGKLAQAPRILKKNRHFRASRRAAPGPKPEGNRRTYSGCGPNIPELKHAPASDTAIHWNAVKSVKILLAALSTRASEG